MKNLFLKFSWLPVLLLLTACWKEPNYPKEPEIEFKSIRSEIVTDKLDNIVPRIFITLKFKDGDGDLGLNKEDLNRAPFNDTLVIVGTDTLVNRTKSNNYFIKAYYKDRGTFVPYPQLTLVDGYRFMRLAPNDNINPLEGDLSYFLDVTFPISLNFPNYKSGDSLRFEVFLTDRELNKSNTVMTDPVAVFEP